MAWTPGFGNSAVSQRYVRVEETDELRGALQWSGMCGRSLRSTLVLREPMSTDSTVPSETFGISPMRSLSPTSSAVHEIWTSIPPSVLVVVQTQVWQRATIPAATVVPWCGRTLCCVIRGSQVRPLLVDTSATVSALAPRCTGMIRGNVHPVLGVVCFLKVG